jgi:5-oxoprolinase (ATP-hydrolysing)
MTADVRTELQNQGFEDKRIHIERMLNMRFGGTSLTGFDVVLELKP